MHQCRVKDGEQRYNIYLSRSRPAPVSTPQSHSVSTPLPTTPSTPVSSHPVSATSSVLIKVSLRWKSVDDKVAGVEIASDASAAQLRALITEDGVNEEFGKAAFAFAQGAPSVLLSTAQEASTPIASLFLPRAERAILLMPAPAMTAPSAAVGSGRAVKVSVILVKPSGDKESIGFLEDVDLAATLENVRTAPDTYEHTLTRTCTSQRRTLSHSTFSHRVPPDS